MLAFILKFHGEVRWLVALVAIIAIVRFTIGLVRKEEYKSMDRGLMSGFVGLLDLNLLLGLIVLLNLGFNSMPRIEHATTMFLAIVVGHSSAAWRKNPSSAIKFRNNLIAIVVALALVAVGVIRLRGGWVWG